MKQAPISNAVSSLDALHHMAEEPGGGCHAREQRRRGSSSDGGEGGGAAPLTAGWGLMAEETARSAAGQQGKPSRPWTRSVAVLTAGVDRGHPVIVPTASSRHPRTDTTAPPSPSSPPVLAPSPPLPPSNQPSAPPRPPRFAVTVVAGSRCAAPRRMTVAMPRRA